MSREIRQEQIRILYSYWPTVVYGSFALTLIVVLILWPVVDHKMLMLWVALNFGLQFLRRKDLKQQTELPVAQQYANYNEAATIYRLYCLCSGIIWGILPIFFFHPVVELNSLIMIIHGGYIAASLVSTAGYDQKSFYAFTVPSSLLFMLGTLLNGGGPFWPLAMMLLFYPTIMSGFASKFNRSITEQVELRIQNASLLADLRQQRDKAEQAMLAKNRFLAAASHDLRQPVHALGLFVGSLEPHLEKSEPRQLVHKIKQTTGALASLFHGLLDISKLDANVVENLPKHIRMQSIIDTVIAEFTNLAAQKSLQLKATLPDSAVALIDPALFERIIRNLVGNAINYTDTGTVELSMTAESNDHWIITIADTGKGIPEDELENIFSEYHQLENPERDRQKGLGLGLAIVRRLCQLMDIQLKVESQPQEGSRFSLRIPAGDPQQIKQSVPMISDADCGDMHVIVIDDEGDILQGMQSVLHHWGCTTIIADNGTKAMQALEPDAPPDVIIADFRLRDNESGLDVIRDIREEYNMDIPAVLITGDTAPERLQQAADAYVQVLHKPVEPEQLRMILGQIATAM